MEQLFVEVDSSDIILGTNEQTHGLLRIHTDECVCGKDAEVTTEFGMFINIIIFSFFLSLPF